MIGSGYATKPLLLILLGLAILVDYWRINQKRNELALLDGESIINPFSEIYHLLRAFITERYKFWHLMLFYRDRRELGFSLLSENQELQGRTAELKEKVHKHYKVLIASAGIILIAASAMTSELLLLTNADSCFACLFDGLKSWWGRLSGMEKGAIALVGFAVSFPLLGFWSAFGVVTTATYAFASGDKIADVIRNPKKLLSPEYAMAAMVTIGLSRIPGGRRALDEMLDVGRGTGNNITKLTVDDIPTAKSGYFNGLFNSLTIRELDELWKDKKIRKKFERQLRAPGGLHEWHLVSRAPQFKYWNVSAEEIKDLRTAISDVKFVNPNGVHGGLGSTKAHNELLEIIDSSNDYNTFVRRLNNWANYRLDGGVSSLPEGLRLK